jgi:monoamine oxidase
LRVVVLEARARIGGRILTRRVRGWPLPIELGAEFVHGASEELFAIARDAGLLVERLPDAHFEAGPSGWTRVAKFWKRLEAATRKMRVTGRDRSVAEFLRTTRALSPVEKRRVAAIVEGYDAADLERASERALSTAGTPPDAPRERAQFRVASGYDGVAKHLASRLDPRRCRVLLSHPVARIRWRRGDVRATVAGGGVFRARRAIVTVPVGVLQAAAGERGAIAFEPDVPDLRRALAGLAMGHVVRIVLRFREPFWRQHPPAGREGRESPVGFVHGCDDVFEAGWTPLPAEAAMWTAWAGGPGAEELLRLPKGERVGRALASIARMFATEPARLRRLLLSAHTHDWSGDPFTRGAYSYALVGGAAAGKRLMRPVAGTLYFAGEAATADESGTVPGAIASGRRAAEKAMK